MVKNRQTIVSPILCSSMWGVKVMNQIIKEREAIEADYQNYIRGAKIQRDLALAQLASKCPRHRYINEVSEERVRRVCKFCGKVLKWY